MRLAVAFLALTTVTCAAQSQPPLPQPGGANRTADATGTSQQPSATNETPARPDAAEPKTAPPSNATDDSTRVAVPDKKQAEDQFVTVRRLPRIDVAKDWIDYSQIALSLILLAVQVVQLIFLGQTVAATEAAAKAAKESADIAMAASDKPSIHFQEQFLQEQVDNIVIRWRNYGQRPATRVQFSYAVTVIDMRTGEIISNDAISDHQTVIDSKQTITHVSGGLPSYQQIVIGEHALFLSGRVLYGNEFGTLGFELRFSGERLPDREQCRWETYTSTVHPKA